MQYRNHRKHSRKSYVHLIRDLFGEEAAYKLGALLRLKKRTLKTWFRAWGRAR